MPRKATRSKAEIAVLEICQFMLDPEPEIAERIQSASDIYTLRSALKQMAYSPVVLAHVASIAANALVTGQRIRTEQVIRVLRSQVRQAEPTQILDGATRQLFVVYRSLILRVSDPLKWLVSRLIKGLRLENSEIEWLLASWEISEHITNRLILYPDEHPLITRWTEQRLGQKDLEGRRAELVARLLPAKGTDGFRTESPNTMAWAILKSDVARETKEGWLMALVPYLSTDTILEAAHRLPSLRLVHAALQ